MASVTEVNDRLNNVEGALLTVYQKITVVTTGDTWVPGLRSVIACGTNKPGSITAAVPDTSDPPVIEMTGTGTDVLAWARGYP